MIHSKWLKLIEKYSFIDKAERKGFKYRFYYTVKGEQKYKKLSLRATVPMIQKAINDIKEEIDFTEINRQIVESIKKDRPIFKVGLR